MTLDKPKMQDVLWKRTPEWFKPWFNTEAYHLLYGHRSEQEARAFVDNLAEAKLLGSPGALLDAGCGSGRHARAFAKHGWNVTGMDLSPNSIGQNRGCLSSANFKVN